MVVPSGYGFVSYPSTKVPVVYKPGAETVQSSKVYNFCLVVYQLGHQVNVEMQHAPNVRTPSCKPCLQIGNFWPMCWSANGNYLISILGIR
jgi:hypothetical protein